MVAGAGAHPHAAHVAEELARAGHRACARAASAALLRHLIALPSEGGAQESETGRLYSINQGSLHITTYAEREH